MKKIGSRISIVALFLLLCVFKSNAVVYTFQKHNDSVTKHVKSKRTDKDSVIKKSKKGGKTKDGNQDKKEGSNKEDSAAVK
jgi:hypothetical protein